MSEFKPGDVVYAKTTGQVNILYIVEYCAGGRLKLLGWGTEHKSESFELYKTSPTRGVSEKALELITILYKITNDYKVWKDCEQFLGIGEQSEPK